MEVDRGIGRPWTIALLTPVLGEPLSNLRRAGRSWPATACSGGSILILTRFETLDAGGRSLLRLGERKPHGDRSSVRPSATWPPEPRREARLLRYLALAPKPVEDNIRHVRRVDPVF